MIQSAGFNSFNDVYAHIKPCFEEDSDLIRTETVRGNRVSEISVPCSWMFHSSPWLTIKGRGINPFFAAAEIFWILSGNGNVDWISRFNKNMRSFSDGEKDFNASYGKRMCRYECGIVGHNHAEIMTYDQVGRAIHKLRKDPTTRQASIIIAHPHYDYLPSKDIACNQTVLFSIRDGKLNTSVTQRSNDFIWGSPYNAIQFWHLGLLIAGELKIERGWHCHFVNNLHLYYDLYPILKDWVESEWTFENLNQESCFQTVTSLEIIGMSHALDIEQEDTLRVVNLWSSDFMQSFNKYWRDLWMLPALYLRRNLHREADKSLRNSAKKRVLLDLEDLNVDPFLIWLVKDFWGMS